MAKTPVSRHDFLKLATKGVLALSGMLGLGGLLRYLSFQADPPPPRQVSLGLAADFPPGTRQVVANGQVLLIHDAEGIHALSLVCTHLGCTVQADGEGFSCPCHASLYAADGTVIRGPAAQALPALRLKQTEQGELLLIKE